MSVLAIKKNEIYNMYGGGEGKESNFNAGIVTRDAFHW